MNNGLCPVCGVEMEYSESEVQIGDQPEDYVIELCWQCPDCEYLETAYDAE